MTSQAVSIRNSGSVQTLSKADLLARLSSVRDQNATNLDAFMNFDGRVGRYTVPSSDGGEPDTFPTGSRVLFNLMDTKHGWSCWKGGTVVDKTEMSVFDPLPHENDLEDHGPYSTDPQKREGWLRQVIMTLRDENGKQYRLRLSSTSARDAFGELLGRVLSEMTMHDLETETPLISLGSESFKAKGQKNYKPRFEIVKWEKNPVAGTEASAPVEDEAASEEAESSAPAKKKVSATRG